MKRAIILLAALAAVLTSAFAAGAGETLLQRTVDYIASPNIADDIGLSSTQVSQRDHILTDFQASRESIVAKAQAGGTGKMEAANDEIFKLQGEMEIKLLALLTPAQVNRLKQIGIQQEGTVALHDDVIAKDLGLSVTQRSKIDAILDRTQKAQDDYQGALGEALAKVPDPNSHDEAAIKAYEAKQRQIIKSMLPKEKQYMAVKAQGDKDILLLLTPAQRTKWTAMHGKPVKGA